VAAALQAGVLRAQLLPARSQELAQGVRRAHAPNGNPVRPAGACP
jgi:hypothetical protein